MRYEKGFSRFVTICHTIIIYLFFSHGIVNRRYSLYNRRKEGGLHVQFSDKLDFLMKITNTTNKELSQAISVDRSLVSLLRTGKRKQPKNLEYIRKMARYFAQKADAGFQRHAIAEMLGQAQIRSSMPSDVLSDCLQKWLVNEQDFVSNILDGMDTLPADNNPPETKPPREIARETHFFYGNEGRREAMIELSSIIRTQEKPSEIYVASDSNMDWLFEDYDFTRELQRNLIDALERGFTLQQILPSMNFINSYTESLRYWLPIYTTGQAKVFYYPRIRDNLYRHTCIVIPGVAVQAVSGIGLQSKSQIALVSTEKELVNAYTQQFRDHMALCRPAIAVHTSFEEYGPCFSDYFARDGFTIQKVSPLSTTTMPVECLRRCQEQIQEPSWKNVFRMFIEENPRFEQRLRDGTFIDISQLANVRDIRAGKVPIASTYKTSPSHPCYTPETYAMHLRNILRLMEEYENYWFVPFRGEMRHDYNLFVNDSGLALIARLSRPALLLELRRPEMVQACKENLLYMTDKDGYDGIRRRKICMEISALIRELQA